MQADPHMPPYLVVHVAWSRMEPSEHLEHLMHVAVCGAYNVQQ